MPKRPDLLGQLAKKNTNARPGANEQITYGSEVTVEEVVEQEEADKPQFKKKTYLLEPELIRAISLCARKEHVPISALVRYLLKDALERVESGELEVPELVDHRWAL